MSSERYPLTSQLIQENKIPEFGMTGLDAVTDLTHADYHSQITYTSTSMVSSTIVCIPLAVLDRRILMVIRRLSSQ